MAENLAGLHVGYEKSNSAFKTNGRIYITQNANAKHWVPFTSKGSFALSESEISLILVAG